MKRVLLIGILLICAIGMMTTCKNGNNSNDVKQASPLQESDDATTIKSNSILDTKWIVNLNHNKSEEDAVYIFINQDSSVVVANRGKDIEYGYVYGSSNDYINIKINGYKSLATCNESSYLCIDRNNNLLYPGFEAYRSRDPRNRQDVKQIPMSDYKGKVYVYENLPWESMEFIIDTID